MVGRILKRLVIAIIILVPIALLVGGVMYYREEERITLEAAATPQIPQVYQSAEIALGEMTLPRDVNVRTVHILYERDDVSVLDVRDSDEFENGHIPGAALMPLPEIDDRLAEVPADQTVIVVCQSGRRSEEAAALLEGSGFDNVLHMTGGVRAWTRAGFEIESTE